MSELLGGGGGGTHDLVTRSVIREASGVKVKEKDVAGELEGFLIHRGYWP